MQFQIRLQSFCSSEELAAPLLRVEAIEEHASAGLIKQDVLSLLDSVGQNFKVRSGDPGVVTFVATWYRSQHRPGFAGHGYDRQAKI